MLFLAAPRAKVGKSGKVPIRIFFLFWYIYTYLIHQFYDCNLRAYLMSVDLEPLIDSAQDIHENVRDV